MRWEALGGPRVFAGTRELEFRGKRALDVLAILMTCRGSLVSIDRLVDALWGEDPPASARNSVQRFVSDIRAGLGDDRDRLASERGGYRLTIHDDEYDVSSIEAQMHGAASGSLSPPEALVSLRYAAHALAAEAFPRCAHLEVVDAEAKRLRALRSAAAEQAARLSLELDRADIAELSEWHGDFPFNEAIAGHLMLALAQAGRQRDALVVHQELRTRLREELGILPGAELNRIELAILDQDVGPRDTPARVVDHGASLIGRDTLVDELRAELAEYRLVTLTGMGGSGKTTIAVHAASALARARGHSKPLIVRLEDVVSKDEVVEAVAQTLGLAPSGQERSVDVLTAEIAGFLTDVDRLVVLDNAEHVIDAVGSLLLTILSVPGQGRVVVTSRERVGVSGERVLPVPGLRWPDHDCPLVEATAVQLFASRGVNHCSRSYGELLNDPASGRVCAIVDGLPLGIELAAAQLALFSPAELAERVEASAMSLGGQRGPTRQASLHHVLEWSWELLSHAEQAMLAELSTYSGWGRDTVEFLDPVSGLETLRSLIDKSLVVRGRTERDEPRFGMLEVVRQFGVTKLVESAECEARDRHAGWVHHRLGQHSVVEAAIDVDVSRQLLIEHVNLKRALEWLAANNQTVPLVDCLVRGAGCFAHHGSTQEVRAIYRDTTDTARTLHANGELSADAFGSLLVAAGDVAHAAGDLEQLIRLGFEAVKLAGEEPFDWAPSILATMAVVVETAALDASCESLLERAEQLVERTEHARLNTAHVAVWRGLFELMNRRHDEACAHFGRALSLDPRPGRIRLLAETGTAVGLFLMRRYSDARQFVAEMESESGADLWHYMVDVVHAIVIGAHDPAEAARLLAATLGPTRETGFSGYNDDARIATGVLAWHDGKPDLCRRVLADPMGRTPITVSMLMEYVNATPGLAMGETDWRQHWQATMQRYFEQGEPTADSWVTRAPGKLTVETALALVGLNSR